MIIDGIDVHIVSSCFAITFSDLACVCRMKLVAYLLELKPLASMTTGFLLNAHAI